MALVSDQLSQFLKSLGTQSWAAFKRVLQYLKGTQSLGLVLGGSSFEITMYTDLNYPECPYTSWYTSGYCTFVAGSCTSWQAGKQPTVAISSIEAEYWAAYKAGQEEVWLRNLLADLGHPQSFLTPLDCNYQGAIARKQNSLYQTRSRHFNKRFPWIGDIVKDETIEPVHVNTSDMLADILTKSVPHSKLQHCLENINLVILSSGRGS